MKAFMFIAVALSVMSTAAVADNRPLSDPQAGSPMDFIIHDQPAKYLNVGIRSDWASGRSAQTALQAPRAPSLTEEAWMDRASGTASGK
ncbi:MAG: hypothetical protein ACRC14_10305 [Paracoccaceae bacterium]